MVDILPTRHRSFLLIPQDVEGLRFLGYLISKEERFRLDICLKSPSTLEGIRFHCDWRLQELLRGYEDVLAKRIQQCESLSEFLEELKMLTENLLSFDNPVGHASISTDFISNVVKQLQAIGWDRIVYVNEEFDTIKTMYRDGCDRKHILVFNINKKDVLNDFSCMVDLPVPFDHRKQQDVHSMTQVYLMFTKIVSSCQQFWNTLKVIDQNCWIIEPDSPSYSCLYRRIALGKNSSLRIVLNPHQATEVPECRFLGPSHVIEPLKEKMNANINLWDGEKSLADNLTTILQMDLPSRSIASKDEIRIECGICYAYRLDDKIPEHTCDDVRCGQTYHTSCLTEWMRSLPNYRQSFNVIFGDCPYCEKKLTVRLGRT